MRETTYHAYLDSHERQIVLHSLVELKNQLIQQGRYTDCIAFELISPETAMNMASGFRKTIKSLSIFLKAMN